VPKRLGEQPLAYAAGVAAIKEETIAVDAIKAAFPYIFLCFETLSVIA
jgi:hypothetical protein